MIKKSIAELEERIAELENTADVVEEGIAGFKMEIWNLTIDNRNLQARIDAAEVWLAWMRANHDAICLRQDFDGLAKILTDDTPTQPREGGKESE